MQTGAFPDGQWHDGGLNLASGGRQNRIFRIHKVAPVIDKHVEKRDKNEKHYRWETINRNKHNYDTEQGDTQEKHERDAVNTQS